MPLPFMAPHPTRNRVRPGPRAADVQHQLGIVPGVVLRVLSGGGRPLEAVLRPGDVLFFGARWAHHTEALPTAEGDEATPSFSLGFRSDGGYLL